MEVYKVKQYIRLASGVVDYHVLNSTFQLEYAIDYAERIMKKSNLTRSDIAVVRETEEVIHW